jgi:hypothetical protein
MAQSVTRRQTLKKFGTGLAGMALVSFGLANRAKAGGNSPQSHKCCGRRPPTTGGFMNYGLVFGLIVGLVAIATCRWLIWQLLQQSGRLLQRLEALEKRIEEQKAENRNRRPPSLPGTGRSAGPRSQVQ